MLMSHKLCGTDMPGNTRGVTNGRLTHDGTIEMH